MSNIFINGGGAGIGSYVVVFKDGAMDPATNLRELRGAYDAGDSIFFSIIEEGASEALIPASGWVDEESKLHLAARDFDDNKTYNVELAHEAHEAAVEVKDGIDLGEGEVPTQEDVKAAQAKLDGESIVVAPVEEPTPVIEIDGVKYFHKCEFDLTVVISKPAGTNFDLLNGSQGTESLEAQLSVASYGPPGAESKSVRLRMKAQGGVNYTLTTDTYTSRAFTVVQSEEEAFGRDEIYLLNCSAYYGFLSEDGKTFISYFNLKSDGAPTKVTSVKSGDLVLPIVDERLPEAAVADAGKVVKVADDGSYELGEAGGGEPEVELHIDAYSIQDMIDAYLAYTDNTYGIEVKAEITAEHPSHDPNQSQTKKGYLTIFSYGRPFIQFSSFGSSFPFISDGIFDSGVVDSSKLNLSDVLMSDKLLWHTNIVLPSYGDRVDPSKIYNLQYNNGLSWQEASSGGTQLYKHTLSGVSWGGPNGITEFVDTSATPYTLNNFADAAINCLVLLKVAGRNVKEDPIRLNNPGRERTYLEYNNIGDETWYTEQYTSENFTDTVTPL